jgi:hypothetical protein
LNSFFLWFSTGVTHIANWQAYDHILFLLALCGVYSPRQWKNLLFLITAFTIGHTLTLALSVLNIIHLSSNITELLIPLTIIVTCIYNLYNRNAINTGNFKANYWMSLLFGLIHGLGFSSVLRSLLGNRESIISPLFAFNTGLEAGQLIIVGCVLLFSVVLTAFFKIKRSDFNFYISVLVLIAAAVITFQRFHELVH